MLFFQYLTAILGFGTNIQTQNEPDGYIESPYYPFPFPSGANSSWLIDLPNGNATVLIQFEKLDLRTPAGSGSATLRILDGPTNTSTLLASFTNTNNATTPRDLQSTGNRVFITFTTTSTAPGAANSGFRIRYRSVTEHHYYNHSSAINISSPNYPENYKDNQLIQWSLALTEANFSRMEILNFVTEEVNDHLEIIKGFSLNDERLTVLSGDVGNYSYINPGTTFFLRFYTDGANTMKGFQAIFLPAYKYVLNQEEGEISSMNYPLPYGNYLTQYWHLTNPYGNGKIFLEFDAMFTELDHDFVTIRDGNNDTSPILGRHSGNSLPPVYLSSGKNLLVTFLSNEATSGTGFHAKFTAVHQDVTLGPTTPAPICRLPGVYSIPFPGSCEKFYLCVNYVEHEDTCAPGLYFDPVLSVCNLASEVDCPWAPTTTPIPETTTEILETTTEASICPPSGIVYVPIPGDCSSYYLCAEGTPIQQKCPEGTLFDPIDLRCEIAEDVDCTIPITNVNLYYEHV